MPKKVLRMLKIAALVPPAPQRIGVRQLVDALRETGFVASARSVQRDLAELSELFPLTSDEESPAGWSWAKGAPRLAPELPEPFAALLVLMADDRLEPTWPEPIRKYVRDRLPAARMVLGSRHEFCKTSQQESQLQGGKLK